MPRLLLTALLLGCIQAPAAAQEHFADREKKAPEKIKRELSALRKEAGAQKWTFKIAYTKAMDHSFARLAGTRFPDDVAGLARKVNALGDKALRVDRLAGNAFAKRHPKRLPGRNLEPRVQYELYAKHKSFDWRTYHKVTPVRNQGQCGTCWDFAALAAFESSYAIRNNLLIHASEQDILDHSRGGSCSGGRPPEVFEYLIKHGTAPEQGYPYSGDQGKHATVAGPYRAVAWGFVTHTALPPTTPMMKEALCRHGPLTVTVHATPAFQAYGGGVFNEHAKGPHNHAITVIGWDDRKGKKGCWLVKNSWGEGWGEKGYMWIEYGCNHVGGHAAWVRARNVHYNLPPSYFHIRPGTQPHQTVGGAVATKP